MLWLLRRRPLVELGRQYRCTVVIGAVADCVFRKVKAAVETATDNRRRLQGLAQRLQGVRRRLCRRRRRHCLLVLPAAARSKGLQEGQDGPSTLVFLRNTHDTREG